MDSQNRVGASPRIDTAMVTAAEVYGTESVGVIMTGMGSRWSQRYGEDQEKQGRAP